MDIQTKVIKKVLYKLDPEAPKDEEFIESVNMILLLMEQEQHKQNKKSKSYGTTRT